jgi:hypothetical protein
MLHWKEFVLESGDGHGREFVVVDETSKNDHSTARHWGRALSGERAELVDVFVHGGRLRCPTGLRSISRLI